jgi:mannose-6-phosphate isomerase-like protein (cupin superfamily)
MRSADAIFMPANAGAVQNILGMTHVTKVSPRQDNTALLALEIIIPARAGVLLHRHATDSEFFYVLEGQITFVTPDGEIVGKPGDFCYLPQGGRHAFRNDGDVPAKALVVAAPGVAAHDFFEDAARAARQGAGPEMLTEIGERHGVFIEAPALA